MTSKVTYKGELSTQLIHIKSRAELSTDAPVDNQGRGDSFSPTDLTATSLASCMLTIMGIKARDKEWKIEESEIEVEKIMKSEPRRIGQINLKVIMNHDMQEKRDQEILEKVARTCPVALSLHPDIKQQIEFIW